MDHGVYLASSDAPKNLQKMYGSEISITYNCHIDENHSPTLVTLVILGYSPICKPSFSSRPVTSF